MIRAQIDCKQCDWSMLGTAPSGNPDSFDNAIRRAQTHAEKTGHQLVLSATIKKEK
jgi:hypothetical protein